MKKIVAVLCLLGALVLFTSAASLYRITLVWDLPSEPSQIEDSWKLYRHVAGGTYTILATIDPTIFTYADNTVQKNKTYFYVITAVRGTEESPYSNEASGVGIRVN